MRTSPGFDPDHLLTFQLTLPDAVNLDRNPQLRYVNAGHNPPCLFRSTAETDELATGGMAIGMFLAAEMSARISRELRTWIDDAAQYDDLTFIMMKVN